MTNIPLYAVCNISMAQRGLTKQTVFAMMYFPCVIRDKIKYLISAVSQMSLPYAGDYPERCEDITTRRKQ